VSVPAGHRPGKAGSDAYAAWREALQEFTSDARSFAEWREHRYAFAHRLGRLLTEAHPPTPAAVGHALYGVYVTGTSLCFYVGQTKNAKRRLRDLPIGESHHLAVTIPPELWSRVIVVQWPELLSQIPDHERERALDDPDTCGMALEHLMQCELHPVVNCFARTTDGRYRERPPERSKSNGARSASRFPKLFETVLETWSALEDFPHDGTGPAGYLSSGRAVFPSALALAPSCHAEGWGTRPPIPASRGQGRAGTYSRNRSWVPRIWFM
jgi:hypothetical protein